MLSDTAIAAQARVEPIRVVASQLGIDDRDLIPYGYSTPGRLWADARIVRIGGIRVEQHLLPQAIDNPNVGAVGRDSLRDFQTARSPRSLQTTVRIVETDDIALVDDPDQRTVCVGRRSTRNGVAG